MYNVIAADGSELGLYDGNDARDALRRALKDWGHTVYPDPDRGTLLMGRRGQPTHIFQDYQVGGETYRVQMLEG